MANQDSRPIFPPPFTLPSAPIASTPAGRVKQVWAVGGGKGGVGKSLLASSLAISLARRNFKTVAIDLDLGGANLHTTLGVDLPRHTLSDFLSRHDHSLKNSLVNTGIPNLEMISGAKDSIGVANLPMDQQTRLLQELRTLDADYVVLDLGAGTGASTIDFFLSADVGMVAILPEPTSIENAYRFIKSAYYRKLATSSHLEPVAAIIQTALDPNNSLGIRSPSDLFREVNRASQEAGVRLKEVIDRFQPRLVMNQARTQTDIDVGFSVKSVCRKYFGIDLDYVGYLDYDSAVWQSVRRKRPVMLEFPNSRLVTSIERVTESLLKK